MCPGYCCRMRLRFASLITCGLVGAALAQQAPGWSRGQQDLAVGYGECRKRATAALKAEGYRIDHDAGAFSVGIKDVHTAVISCVISDTRDWKQANQKYSCSLRFRCD
jgi:hypothetical protein